jgi:hypothetical protein
VNGAKNRCGDDGVFYVHHAALDAREALALAHRGYVLENGRIMLQGSAAELARSPAVVEAYLGAVPPAGPSLAGNSFGAAQAGGNGGADASLP